MVTRGRTLHETGLITSMVLVILMESSGLGMITSVASPCRPQSCLEWSLRRMMAEKLGRSMIPSGRQDLAWGLL